LISLYHWQSSYLLFSFVVLQQYFRSWIVIEDELRLRTLHDAPPLPVVEDTVLVLLHTPLSHIGQFAHEH